MHQRLVEMQMRDNNKYTKKKNLLLFLLSNFDFKRIIGFNNCCYFCHINLKESRENETMHMHRIFENIKRLLSIL